MTNLKKRDFYIVLAAVLLPLISGFLAMGIQDLMTVVLIIVAMTLAAALAVIIGVYAIYKGRGTYGGEVARNLEIIALGFLLFMIAYIPHTLWHVMGLPDALGPGWSLLSSAWWAGFFHIGAIAFFLISTYGFYRFWKD